MYNTKDCKQLNDHGTAIVSALLILMLLTFVAIMATQTTTSEKKMVRSEAVFQKDFFHAEAAAHEGIQKMVNENAPSELLPNLITPASNNYGLLESADAENPENDVWNLDGDGDKDFEADDIALLQHSESDPTNNTYRVVVQKREKGKDSLSAETSRLYTYYSYGYSEANGGRSMIKMGYKRRF